MERTQAREALAWLGSYSRVSKWMRRHSSILERLEETGLLVIDGLFPPGVAEGVLAILQGIGEWNSTSASEDYTHNNIEHQVPCRGWPAGCRRRRAVRALQDAKDTQANWTPQDDDDESFVDAML